VTLRTLPVAGAVGVECAEPAGSPDEPAGSTARR
jgi:hypothetical protein